MSKAKQLLVKARSSVKNGMISGVQNSCGLLHLGLKYAIDSVESVEVYVMKIGTGQVSKSTRNERRLSTLDKQARVAASLSKIKEKFNLWEKSDTVVEDVNHEMQAV